MVSTARASGAVALLDAANGPGEVTMDEQTPEQERTAVPEGELQESAPSSSNGQGAADEVAEAEPEVNEAVAEEPAERDDHEEEPASEADKRWYVLKVQSGREDSIRDSLERRVAIEGLEEYFGEIIVPTEKVSEIKGGKRRVSERKLYPGYIMIQMELNDPTWYMVRDTPGVGDFTGAAGQKPMPMLDHEVEKMLGRETAKEETQPRLKIDFHPGDTVKIKEGPFENFEGNVEAVDEANGRVTVVVNIFGRSCPVELEYWQVEGI
jgi:transcriptional antiterminator NusG